MSIKLLCVYSLLANLTLGSAVAWQNSLRETAVQEERAIALDQQVLLHEQIVRELASDDPARIDGVESMCQRQLAALKPRVATIWDVAR